MANTDQILTVFDRLAEWGAGRAWVGPDPYEGLNSALGRLPVGVRGRQAVVQVYKRLPFAPPWPLSAPGRANSKALGLVLSGYATRAGAALPSAQCRASLADRLRDLRIDTGQGWGWGYHFDVQTRHLFYPASAPNAVASSFVVNSLLDNHEHGGSEVSAETALGARPFLLSLLQRSPAHGPYFAYVAAGSRLVHNANLLVCGALARLHRVAPDDAAAEVAVAAAETTLAAQSEDGLWPYGVGPDLAWIDNFHTAYILESLVYTDRAFGAGQDALLRGLGAWREQFFDSAANAGYYANRPSPLEVHSFASAIDLCSEARRVDSGLLELGLRLAERAIALLWIPQEGRFGFRVAGRRRNDREFMRWTNAPMFRALGRLLSAPAP